MRGRRQELAQGASVTLGLVAQALITFSGAAQRAAQVLEAAAESLEDRTETSPTGPTVPRGATGGIEMPVGPDYAPYSAAGNGPQRPVNP